MCLMMTCHSAPRPTQHSSPCPSYSTQHSFPCPTCPTQHSSPWSTCQTRFSFLCLTIYMSFTKKFIHDIDSSLCHKCNTWWCAIVFHMWHMIMCHITPHPTQHSSACLSYPTQHSFPTCPTCLTQHNCPWPTCDMWYSFLCPTIYMT